MTVLFIVCICSERLNKHRTHTEEVYLGTRISNDYLTYHEGYFLLILWLPPDGQNDGRAEDKKQGEKSQAPGFQSCNGLDSVRGQNTQAQDEKGCGGQYTRQSQHILFSRLSVLGV